MRTAAGCRMDRIRRSWPGGRWNPPISIPRGGVISTTPSPAQSLPLLPGTASAPGKPNVIPATVEAAAFRKARRGNTLGAFTILLLLLRFFGMVQIQPISGNSPGRARLLPSLFSQLGRSLALPGLLPGFEPCRFFVSRCLARPTVGHKMRESWQNHLVKALSSSLPTIRVRPKRSERAGVDRGQPYL